MMMSGIGLYLKLCLDKRIIQNDLTIAFGRSFRKTTKSKFISAGMFPVLSFLRGQKKEKEENKNPELGVKRKFIIIGNLKMNGRKREIKNIICKIKKSGLDLEDEIVLAVPSVYLERAKKFAGTKIQIAAQNSCQSSEDGAAYTGEINNAMLYDLGVEWVLLGDADRRLLFGESDNLIAQKLEDALCDGIKVIIGLVESKEDGKRNKTLEVVYRQLKAIQEPLTQDWCSIVLAYEPVSSFEAELKPERVQEIHSKIREWLKVNVNAKVADHMRIIYAGNVSPQNVQKLSIKNDIDGFLIGEKSCTPEFIDIIKEVNKTKKEKKEPCIKAQKAKKN